MAADVWAAMWHMSAVAAGFRHWFPGHDAAFFAQIPTPGYLIVDRHGRRHCDESSVDSHGTLNVIAGWHPETGLRDRVPSYVVFDEHPRTSGKIFNNDIFNNDFGYNRHYVWSEDNGAEIERGWISTRANWPPRSACPLPRCKRRLTSATAEPSREQTRSAGRRSSCARLTHAHCTACRCGRPC
jgi:hypothetical protein